MRYSMLLVGTVYRKKEPVAYTGNNGQRLNSYKVIFDNGEDTEDTKISEEAYNLVEAKKSYIFKAEFNSAYANNTGNGVRITGVVCELEKEIFADELAVSVGNTFAKKNANKEK